MNQGKAKAKSNSVKARVDDAPVVQNIVVKVSEQGRLKVTIDGVNIPGVFLIEIDAGEGCYSSLLLHRYKYKAGKRYLENGIYASFTECYLVDVNAALSGVLQRVETAA